MFQSSSLTVRFGLVATFIAALGLSACRKSSHDAAPAPAADPPPTVSSVTPASGATGVATNSSVNVTFSEAMTASTIIPANISVGGLPAGTVVYDAVSHIATYTPASPFAASTLFTVTVSTGVTDLAGQPLAAAFVWGFTTGTSSDTTPPTVTGTTPASGATGVLLNHKPTASFSESMQSGTLTTTSFTLVQGTTSVAGTVTYSDAGFIAMFTPTAPLLASSSYTATITTAVLDLAGNALAANYVWSFTTGSAADTTPPLVSYVSPPAGASGVSLTSGINATFSEPMDPTSITTATFTLMDPTPTAVTGTMTFVNSTVATFRPSSPLAANTVFTAQLSGVTDVAGNPLAAAFVWTFTSAMTSDTTPALVRHLVPAASATGVDTNSLVTVTMNEWMAPGTLLGATFTLDITAGAAVTGVVHYADAGQTAVFVPAAALQASTSYTATLTTAVTDLSTTALPASITWTFMTGTTADTTAPTVTGENPADLATAVPIDKKICATFSEPLDPMTLSTATFTLTGPSATPILGTIAYDAPSQIATFLPVANLANNTLYTATLTVGVTDAAGEALFTPHVWTFTTGTVVGQQPVNLRTAGPFAAMAGSAVANTGATIVNGELGLTPGTSVTGIGTGGPGTVNGTIHVNNTAVAQADLDLTTAFNDAQGRTTGSVSLPANVGGLTLTPGLYTNASSSGISGTGANGILTLDAQGDASATFIFKMATTWITDASTSVVLVNGAKAKNIYWSVGSSATLGSGSIFYGNILADQSVTLSTGATVTGRLLARVAGVTLGANTVTLPSP